MARIKVSICTGTACFVMGASEILLLEDELPEDLKDKVEIAGAVCLGVCKENSSSKAPFVLVDGELVSEATLQMVIEKIRGKIC